MGTPAAMRRGALAAQKEEWPGAYENLEGFQRGDTLELRVQGDVESCPSEAR